MYRLKSATQGLPLLPACMMQVAARCTRALPAPLVWWVKVVRAGLQE